VQHQRRLPSTNGSRDTIDRKGPLSKKEVLSAEGATYISLGQRPMSANLDIEVEVFAYELVR
jgi:hypothetical protein